MLRGSSWWLSVLFFLFSLIFLFPLNLVNITWINQVTSELQFTSWNIRGLIKLVKLKQFMSRISQLNIKIIYLQDTISRMTTWWSDQVFPASFTLHSCGIITLIHNSLPFHLISIKENWFGSYLIIQCEILSGWIWSICIDLIRQPLLFQSTVLLSRYLAPNFIKGDYFNLRLHSDIKLQEKFFFLSVDLKLISKLC